MTIWLLVERFYCDTTVLWGYTDRECADAQADLLNDQNEELGESGYYDVYQVEVM